jgi:alkaline phosphatase
MAQRCTAIKTLLGAVGLTLILSSFPSCGKDKGQDTGAMLGSLQHQEDGSNSPAPPVKNVILMIGDGMGLQQVSQAVLYRQLRKSTEPELALEKLLDSKYAGLMRTSSYGDIVTDSAAAATSMACGIKTLNEVVGVDPNGYACETILEKASKMGKATGLVTTTTLSHATPAGFSAHQIFRKMENEIAVDIIEKHDIDVMLAGGLEYVIPQYKDEVQKVPMKGSDLEECKDISPEIDGKSKRQDQKNLIATAKSEGYQFVCDKAQLDKVSRKKDAKLLGLFTQSVFPMIQERNAIGSMPNLAEMTKVALEILSKNENGFFVMVEGGLIDYAGHDNDAGTMLQETLDFDRAVQAAVAFTETHPGTLLIVTADHETGGFGFAYGKKIDFEMALPSGLKYQKPYDFAPFTKFDYLDSQKMSFRAMVTPIEQKLYPKDPSKADPNYGMEQATKELITVVESNSKYKITEVQAQEVLTRKEGGKDAQPHDFGHFYVHASVHPDMLGRVTADQSHAVWAAGTHTSTPVPVMAVGPTRYSDRVRGFIDNTEIAKIIEDAFNGR